MSEKNEDITEFTLGKLKFTKVNETVEQFREAQHWAVQLAVLVAKVLQTFLWTRAIVQIVVAFANGGNGLPFLMG